jgi:tRNA(Ile)-lysidine synthase
MNIAHIMDFLQEKCHLSPGSVLAVAVSGGADSVCLLHLLRYLQYNLIGLHFNHHIRPESDEDAKFVQDLCLTLGIPFIGGDGNVPEYVRVNHKSIEESARVLRYRFLFDVARKEKAQAVLTAHHSGDQAETILMHLIRGAGSAGLRGMQANSLLPGYDSEIPLIRPFLETSKQEILDYCQSNNLNFVHDSSNDDDTYFRNWLRNDLLPQIEAKNPRFQESLNRTAKIISDEFDWMQETLEVVWQVVCLNEDLRYFQFDYSRVNDFNKGLFRAFARRAIQKLRPNLRDIDFEDIERMYQFVQIPPKSGRIDLVAGLDVVLEDGVLSLIEHHTDFPVTAYPQIDQPLQIDIPGSYNLGTGYKISAEILDLTELDSQVWKNAEHWQAYLDLNSISQPLYIRTKQPGDRIALLGQGGHTTKVSDVFINNKIPKTARRKFPLVCSGEQIVWIPGIQIANHARLSYRNTRCLHLMIKTP